MSPKIEYENIIFSFVNWLFLQSFTTAFLFVKVKSRRRKKEGLEDG